MYIEKIGEYIAENYLEIMGVVLSFCYLFFSVRGKPLLWVFGFLSAICYLIVFFKSKFFAIGSLQIYYIVVSVYGFFFWILKKEKDEQAIKTTSLNRRQFAFALVAVMLLFALFYYVLTRFTASSSIPLGDSFTTAIFVVGTWLLARKILENWLFFIVADSICISLFIYQKMYLTSLLFLVYTTMGIIGYIRWKKQMYP